MTDIEAIEALLAEKVRAQAEYSACNLCGPDEPRLCAASCVADRAADDAVIAAFPVLVVELRALREVKRAAEAWRDVPACPDHSAPLSWCTECQAHEAVAEALTDALAKAGRS